MRYLLLRIAALALLSGFSPTAMSAGSAAVNPVQLTLDRSLRGTAAVAVILDTANGRLLAVERHHAAALQSSSPGSTLKPFFLNLALERGLIRDNTILYCQRNLRIAGHELACTHPTALTAFRADEAIAYSCNSYFAQLSARFTPKETAAVLREYGFGSRSHLFESESAGEVRTPSGEAQRALEVLGIAGVSATPAQMAEAYWLLDRRADVAPAVGRGLRESVTYGMAHPAITEGISLLGKTGTASDAGERWTHGWFAGIASYGGCRVVVVIFVPHGNGGDAAMLAHRFLLTWRNTPER
jgi:cell division protein FtsI/penicillin-binding protein 2